MYLVISLAFLHSFCKLTTATSSSGCGSNFNLKSRGKHHITTLSDSNRTYMYWLPASYKQSSPTPLIFSFHALGETSTDQKNLDLLTDPYFNTEQIVVYPQASQPDGESETAWEGLPSINVDDITFFMNVLDELEEELCIDKTRIYATGKSEGGGFVGRLACNSTSAARIAAFAPVSGAFYVNGTCDDPDTIKIPCNPGRTEIPFLEIHGGADPVANITGGERRGACLPSIKHYMQEWAERDGFDSALTYKLTKEAKVYKSDDNGTVTFVYAGDDVAHDWPFTIDTSDTNKDGAHPASFNASSVIIEWFGNFTL